MAEWDEILNKITHKYKKATQAAITKQVFKEEDFKKENSKKSKDAGDDEMNIRSEIKASTSSSYSMKKEDSTEFEKFRERIKSRPENSSELEKIRQRSNAGQDYSKDLEKFRHRIIAEQNSKKSQDEMKNSKSEKNVSSGSNYYYPYMKKEPSDK